MRNYILNRLNQKNLEVDSGFLFQNLVYFYLKEITASESSKVNYWRTVDGAEVDFVINSGTGVWPIEVKYSNLKEIKKTRSMNSFIDAYHPKKMTIVNLVLNKTEKISDVNFEALPIGELIDYKTGTDK